MIESSLKGDFLVDDVYTFEVGSRNKDMLQIGGLENACMALDDIESGSDNGFHYGFLF